MVFENLALERFTKNGPKTVYSSVRAQRTLLIGDLIGPFHADNMCQMWPLGALISVILSDATLCR